MDKALPVRRRHFMEFGSARSQFGSARSSEYNLTGGATADDDTMTMHCLTKLEPLVLESSIEPTSAVANAIFSILRDTPKPLDECDRHDGKDPSSHSMPRARQILSVVCRVPVTDRFLRAIVVRCIGC